MANLMRLFGMKLGKHASSDSPVGAVGNIITQYCLVRGCGVMQVLSLGLQGNNRQLISLLFSSCFSGNHPVYINAKAVKENECFAEAATIGKEGKGQHRHLNTKSSSFS